MPTNHPIVLLRERDGDRYLPIWIGAAEATAIAYAQQGIEPPRPLTHDLMKNVIEGLGHRLTEVRIVEIKDGVFHAALVFDGTVEISALREIGRNLDLFFGVQNLFDKEYYVGFAPTTIGTPRLVNGGLRVRWSGR